MQKLKGKIIYLICIVFMVFVILVSNLGQNFKDDIFSYNYLTSHNSKFASYWNNGEQYQNYIDSSSKYIINMFKDNDIAPLRKDGYIQEWSLSLPSVNGESSLEILSGSDKQVKEYVHGKDFFEDFRTSISPGSIKGKPYYIKNLRNMKYRLPRIILFDGYSNKSPNEIDMLDNELKSRGVELVISPSDTTDLKYDSDLYGIGKVPSDNYLLKIIVPKNIFDEIKDFSNKNYKIRAKSKASIKQTTMKNVYGVLKGKNTSYKPLLIVTFYDGVYRNSDSSAGDFKKYTTTPSIILDTLRCLKLQRLKKPDRSIIFAFLSGYMLNRNGLDVFLKNNYDGDYIILEGLGTGRDNVLSFNKSSRNFSSLVEKFINKNDFRVVSKNINSDYKKNLIYITTLDSQEAFVPDYQTACKSGKLILSIIGDECYNLDFLSGSIREIRIIKGFIRDYTLILAALALGLLLLFVFKFDECK